MNVQTERLNPLSEGIDALPQIDVLSRLLSGQVEAVKAIADALPELAAAADLVRTAVREGRRLVYVGAGSSGLMAHADAAELHGTFGLDLAKISVEMPGGIPQDAHLPGQPEDDGEQAQWAASKLDRGDCAVVLSASGSTPYVLAFAARAHARGVGVIAIANNPGAVLFDHCTVAVLLNTPPEMIAGSTRLGAATAQKVALNMISTLVGIGLGQVYDGYMVGLVADNEKLRARACRIVMQIAAVDRGTAEAALREAEGEVKTAVLLARGAAQCPKRARRLLDLHDGKLRDAMSRRT